MADERRRRLERAASQGDREARLQLGRERIRAGNCPWCDSQRERRDEGDNGDQECCCFRCFRERLVHPCGDDQVEEGRRAGERRCDDCPIGLTSETPEPSHECTT